MVDAYRGEPPQEPEPTGDNDNDFDDDIDTDSGIAEIMALNLAPDEEHKEICAFMAKKFVRRGPAGGAPPPRGAGGWFQLGTAARFWPAGVANRPPPCDRNVVSCVNCASECRQPELDRDQRPFLDCNKPGYVSAKCPDRKAPIKAITTDKAASPAFLGCVEAVDKDGIRLVPHRPRQRGQVWGDFIKPTTISKTTMTTTISKTHNRYRALTVADLSEIDAVVNPPDISSPMSWCVSSFVCPTSVSSSSCFHLRCLHPRVKRGAPLF